MDLPNSAGGYIIAPRCSHSGARECCPQEQGGELKQSKSASHLSVRSYLVGFDIGPIKTRHETSSELSSLLGYDVVTPRIISTGVHKRFSALGRETV